jgi:nucleoside-diphosphate-sugar epimerase
MKILVTGATGHIGGAAANALRLRGHQVSGFMRPGLVYGNGGSYDIPHLINLARKNGVAPRLGSGGTLDGCVHIIELAELLVLAVERAPKDAVRHGVAGELSQRDLAAAVSRMIGAGDRTESFTLDQMFRSAESVGISPLNEQVTL